MKSFLEEDRCLLSRCFCGDKKAAKILVRQFSGIVYRSVQSAALIGRQVAVDPSLLEDLHNTVFLQLFENNCKELRQHQG